MKVRIITTVSEDGGGFCVTLCLKTDLPFAPFPGLIFGRMPHSDRGNDLLTVQDVCWNHPHNVFLVYTDKVLVTTGYGLMTAVEYFYEFGWELYLWDGFGIETAREIYRDRVADGVKNDGALIRVPGDDEIYCVDENDLKYLRATVGAMGFEVVDLSDRAAKGGGP